MDPFLLVATAVAVLTLWGAISYVRKYIAAQGVRGQLDAKDAIIETNRQTIDSFEARIATLEREVRDGKTLSEDALRKLDIANARYHELERYAAPEALSEILRKLKEIEGKL